jgi:hypothetical protein
MSKHLLATAIVVIVLVFSPLIRAQTTEKRESGKNIHRDGWDRIVPNPSADQQAGPAPVRDITGIWEPTPGYRDGVFATGPKNYPSDSKPEHELPFTPLGLKRGKSTSLVLEPRQFLLRKTMIRLISAIPSGSHVSSFST